MSINYVVYLFITQIIIYIQEYLVIIDLLSCSHTSIILLGQSVTTQYNFV